MSAMKVLNSMCQHLRNLPMKSLCIMLVMLQGFFLDGIIIKCYGDGVQTECAHCPYCFWWIAGDVLMVAAFITTFVFSYKNIKHYKLFQRLSKRQVRGSLPLSCLTWFVYSCFVAARVVVIFKRGIDDMVDEKDFYGPQFLKTGIALSGVVFILFVASHHDAKENSLERLYINSVASGVTFDILDTVDFLDVLFVKETHVVLPFALENAILAISVINLIRPTLSFMVLFLKHFGVSNITRELCAANIMTYIFLLNLPFMVIRMYLWHNLSQDMSVFMIKNFIMIFIGIHELYEIGVERKKETADPNSIEMGPRNLTHAHRPTDLVDNSSESPPPDYRLVSQQASNPPADQTDKRRV